MCRLGLAPIPPDDLHAPPTLEIVHTQAKRQIEFTFRLRLICSTPPDHFLQRVLRIPDNEPQVLAGFPQLRAGTYDQVARSKHERRITRTKRAKPVKFRYEGFIDLR